MEKEFVLQKIKNAVTETHANAKIILYGSRARGTENKDSDWDILVLLNKPEVAFVEEQKIRHNLYDIELELGEPISTFVYSQTDWNTKMSVTPLYKSIQQEGILL